MLQTCLIWYSIKTNSLLSFSLYVGEDSAEQQQLHEININDYLSTVQYFGLLHSFRCHLTQTIHPNTLTDQTQPPIVGQCPRNVTEGLWRPSGPQKQIWLRYMDVPWSVSFTSPVRGFKAEPAGCLRTDSCHAFICIDVICSNYMSCFSWRWNETCPSWLTPQKILDILVSCLLRRIPSIRLFCTSSEELHARTLWHYINEEGYWQIAP